MYHWDWMASVSKNMATVRVPGMRGVRGIDALKEPGVRIVSRWNQSNWASIVKELAPDFVRAATKADRLRLCELWQGQHSYQSWPVLLGCRAAPEYEPPCGNVGAVVQIACASIDLTGSPIIAGTIFDETRYFRIDHSVHPPEICHGKHVVRMGDVGIAMCTYPTAPGHFVPIQLPNVLLLHRNLPPGVPIIVADAPVTRRYLEPLIASGVAPPGRFLFRELKSDGTILQAASVFTVINSHFTNVVNGEVGYKVARAAYSPNGPVPPAQRTAIVLIDRGQGKSRSMANLPEVRAALEAAAALYSPRRGRSNATRANAPLHVINWRPSRNVTADIEVFRHAALIVGPHGAGLANMLFASEGTPVIEVCYDDVKGMLCPAMYAAMGATLHMPYWVITGSGSYSSPMTANLSQLETAVGQALEARSVRSSPRHAGPLDGGKGGSPASLVRRVQRQARCHQHVST